MVSGDVNFVDAAMMGTGEELEAMAGAIDPTHALQQARDITEPFYRARALAGSISGLMDAGRNSDASDAAQEALAAARPAKQKKPSVRTAMRFQP